MHIAICDDNIGDRKQLERLLERESDRRRESSGVFYTDSFGNADLLIANPMQYDAFYIDMCNTENKTGIDVTKALLEKGVNVPIILCCSSINYREHSFPENVLYIDKPIKVDELTASIDYALETKKHAISLIELRTEKCTIYVTEPDIVYATEEGRNLNVCLADGRTIQIGTDAMNFFYSVENYPSFFAPNPKTIINARNIQKIGIRKITLSNGTCFKVTGSCMKYAKQAYDECQK